MKKKCFKCGVVKNIESFPLNKSKKSGRDGRCKECNAEASREYYKNNRGIILEKEKQSRKQNPDYWHKKDFNYKHSVKGVIARIKAVKKYNQKYPEKHKAHTAVSTAIHHHGFPKAEIFLCNICRERQAQEYHHHNGYEKEHWLDVIPVCKKCHNIIEHNNQMNGG